MKNVYLSLGYNILFHDISKITKEEVSMKKFKLYDRNLLLVFY